MKEQSATVAHEIFSLFLESTAVKVTINGTSVAVKPFPRDWSGARARRRFWRFRKPGSKFEEA
jgi:hypothetical protein